MEELRDIIVSEMKSKLRKSSKKDTSYLTTPNSLLNTANQILFDIRKGNKLTLAIGYRKDDI